ncbi:TetR/AcrR family transcriptional regulator [Amycolatopsis sp. 195334CR]|uniref:TetR/AcrR family transcriptional regulator n=1 Tax=Amycolatopsis sp. 195334CR TaxID=2814588 RepID=UPI001A8CBAA3|nr:TetR/AcrR family transcriptional regulator [Amycolatopsis sp. 195334CR]MBN6038945.1 TetR/AcrR family transcriptional regulator [Amycolatopsis sp. 195334CR]
MAAHPDPETGVHRPWRGVAAEERQARRRDQLLDACFSIMGTQGVAAVTMRGVCREAKLTERYFYESFRGREELLIAVLEMVARQARDVLVAALEQSPPDSPGLVRHAVAAFTEFVTADPRRGRVLFVESLAAPELASRGTQLVEEFTATIALGLRSPVLAGENADEQDVELNAQAVFGALAWLYQAWLNDRVPVGRDRFVRHAVRVIEQIAQAGS